MWQMWGKLRRSLRPKQHVLAVLFLLLLYLVCFKFVLPESGSGAANVSAVAQPASTSQQNCDSCVQQLTLLRHQATMMREKLAAFGVDWASLMPKAVDIIYVITPTHAVATQKADLTRLMNTLCHVVGLHWIVVEDATARSPMVQRLLADSGLAHTHLHTPTPQQYRLKAKSPRWTKPRGVFQRNAAIDWLRSHVLSSGRHGVVYFADDDNTYSVQLFAQMRDIERVGVWPVGLVGGLLVERPAVTDGHVTGWMTSWRPDRSFATDMAGFAVHSRLLFSRARQVYFSVESPLGLLESDFLTGLGVTLTDLEPKASMCTQVLVWHTQTKQAVLSQELRLKQTGKVASNLGIEV